MLRQEQAERTRAVLLDAAACEFAQWGVPAARLTEMVGRVHMTKGAMYNYFTTKQQMVDAILTETRSVWPDAVGTVRAAQLRGLPAVVELVGVVGRTLRDDMRARAAMRIVLEDPDQADEPPFAWWHDTVVLFLQQAIADGEVDESIDTHKAARVLLQSVYGVCSLSLGTGLPGDVEVRLTEMLDLFLPGLRARRLAVA